MDINVHVWLHTDGQNWWEQVTKSVNALRTEMRKGMASTQEQLDSIVAQIKQGVEELRTEIARLAAANPAVDFTDAQALADALATDNIPAVAVEEPPIV